MIETDCNIAVLLGIVAGVYIAGAYITAFLMGMFLYIDEGLDDDDYFVIFVWPFSLMVILFVVVEDNWNVILGATRRIPLVGWAARFAKTVLRRPARFAKTVLRWAAIPLNPYALGRTVAQSRERRLFPTRCEN